VEKNGIHQARNNLNGTQTEITTLDKKWQTIKKIIEPTNQPSPIAPFKKMAELVIIDLALLFVFEWKRSTSLWELTFILFRRI
jgi:hypothetical protein